MTNSTLQYRRIVVARDGPSLTSVAWKEPLE
jgi:hypothetical protein